MGLSHRSVGLFRLRAIAVDIFASSDRARVVDAI
jgi:hypothetical protein